MTDDDGDPPTIDLGIAGVGPGQPVGSGGFGTVFRAEQPAFARTVAVKVLTGTLDDRTQRRFERECRAVGPLSDHPGVVTVFDAGATATGSPYLTMAFHEDGSLADRVARDGADTWQTALRVGVEVGSALAAAHRIDVLHRDVKPANILVSRYGNAVLADFGIARVAGVTQTRADSVTASLLHAAPEVLEGKPSTPSGDLYSLGATLHELVTGRPCFAGDPGEPIAALVSRIATAPVPDLAPFGVPRDVAVVFARTLAKTEAERPQSADELVQDMAGLARRHDVDLGAIPVPAAEPPPEEPAGNTAEHDPGTTNVVSPFGGTPGAGGPFARTHAAPGQGLPAWSAPDPGHAPAAMLDPWLPVQVVKWWGEWAHIRCSNGWEAWVNGTLLVPAP